MSSTALRRVGDFSFSPLEMADINFLVEIRNECRGYLHDDRSFTVEQATEWFIKAQPEFWVVERFGERLGYFRTSGKSVANRHIMAGADIHNSFRGRGLGFAAWCAFLNFQFADFSWKKVSLEVLDTNPRALNLYKKLGFAVEGTKRSEVLRGDQWLDSTQMSLLDSEWRAQPWFNTN